jgi:spermidine synthase
MTKRKQSRTRDDDASSTNKKRKLNDSVREEEWDWTFIYTFGKSEKQQLKSDDEFKHLFNALFGLNDPLEAMGNCVYVYGTWESNKLVFIVCVTTIELELPTQIQSSDTVRDMNSVKLKWYEAKPRFYFLTSNQRKSNGRKSETLSADNAPKFDTSHTIRFYKFYSKNISETTNQVTNYGEAIAVYNQIEWQTNYTIIVSEESKFNTKVVVSEMDQWRFMSFGNAPDYAQIQGKVKLAEKGYDFSGRCGYIDCMATASIAHLSGVYSDFPTLSKSKLLFAGLGAGTLPNIFCRHFPDMSIDVVEIDSVVASNARKYFGFDQKEKATIIIEDIRNFVENYSSESRYDSIFFDCYVENDQGIPKDMCTSAFMKQIASLLKPSGAMIINVYWTGTKRGLKQIFNVFNSVFSSVTSLAVRECADNYIVLAHNNSTSSTMDLDTQSILNNVELDFDFKDTLQYGLSSQSI